MARAPPALGLTPSGDALKSAWMTLPAVGLSERPLGGLYTVAKKDWDEGTCGVLGE